MPRPGFADRNRLSRWADTRQSQGELPRLVRRLILESTPGIVELGMPAGEGVAAGGWDGSVRATAPTAWVPDGLSVWELSVEDRPGAKADNDYSKRTATPDGSPTESCTYVAAILRPWTKRNDWAAAKRGDGKWRDVRAYGLDDVETWLEAAPVTWAWFSEELGMNPRGMQTAQTLWDAWASQTSPVLAPDLVLAGRDAAVDAILSRRLSPGVTTIEGASLDEACAFIAAIAVKQDLAGDSVLIARLAFVDDLATWRTLLDSPAPIVLVPMQADFALEVSSSTHHTVLVPVTETRVADIALPPLDASGVAASLVAAGMDDARADDASRLARRSLTAMRRHVAQNPALHRPRWADPPVTRQVRAALLAGRWVDQSEGDKQILGELAGESYDDFREVAAELAIEADPFIIRVGGSWHLVSAFDAWRLLAERLTEEDLKRLETAVVRVLGEVDPGLDVPENERWWKASFEGKVRSYSSDLRRGLARSLALLGVHGDRIKLSGGANGSSWATHLVRSLLRDANEDQTGRTWVSISDLLPLLAEAAPDAVIDAITAGTSGEEPTLTKLFTDKDDAGILSSSSPHSHLLWALERLAWSTDHFGAAIDRLARLAEIDPGGRLSNRPSRSLAEVFCPWHPENAATPERRLKIIDQLRRRHEKVSWGLLRSMLPEFHGTHFPTNAPHYRDWKPLEVSVTRGEYLQFISEIVKRCVADAGVDGERWQSLLSDYSNLPPDDRRVVLRALVSLVDDAQLSRADADRIWTTLQELVGRHREFADAEWALSPEAITQLDELILTLEPEDAFSRYEWLFQDYMPHVGDVTRREDHAAYEALVADKRRDAVEEIDAEGGLPAVRRLAASVEVSWSVGVALADARPSYDDELLPFLSSDRDSDLQLATQYYFQRFRREGWPWLESLFQLHPELSALQRARLLLAARDLPRSWEVADEQGKEVADHYWKLFVPYGLGGDFGEVEYVARRLMAVGRNAMAVDFVHMYSSGHDENGEQNATLIVTGLENLLQSPDDSELRALSGYDFETSFELLERHRDLIGVDRLARLEWAWLPALGFDPEVPSLHEGMTENPDFFVEVVCAVYRPRNDDEEQDTDDVIDEQREARAHNGYRLLSSWDRPPGLVDSTIDEERLHEWLREAERLLRDRGRLEVGLVHIGQVLASAPADEESLWPPRVVRDLFEELHNEQVEGGFSTAIFNNRGVTSRGLEEGGEKEIALATRYRSDADRFADEWPRTAAVLRRLASSYEEDARRNDDSAERFRRGLE
jgi:hypothetical protein